MNSAKYIAKLLRTPEKTISQLQERMESLTGKKGILEKIKEENLSKINSRLKNLKVSRNSKAEEIFQALQEKTKQEDEALFKLFKKPEFSTTTGCRTLINFAKELFGERETFCLKLSKAKGFLRKNPPKNILNFFGYRDISELLAKEDIWEIFCGLRFVEDPHWLNDVFFKPYEDLKNGDFEERQIEVMVLSKNWLEMGRKFVGKKLHHISHLKELGLIFVVPFEDHYQGATLEVFSLILHYLNEVDFYSKIFKKYSQEPNFGPRLIQALQGVVSGQDLNNNNRWRIVQRYLAKDDANDPRLFEPHVNPEVIHWEKAEASLVELGKRFAESDLEFFNGLDHVGDYFRGSEELVSFDLIDNVISLTKSGIAKYLYHQQEALWNKIFIDYLGEQKLEELVIENLDRGYIEL